MTSLGYNSSPRAAFLAKAKSEAGNPSPKIAQCMIVFSAISNPNRCMRYHNQTCKALSDDLLQPISLNNKYYI